MQRIPEPELMDQAEQVLQYAMADFHNSDQDCLAAILSLLDSAPTWRARVIDLGCGPGNISFPLAAALPSARVLAIDGSGPMLAWARQRQGNTLPPPANLRFHQALLPLGRAELACVEAAHAPPYTLVVSNSLLHHLHDPLGLWRTVREIAAPGALLLVRDLRRPACRQELLELVSRHAASAPALLRRDFEASLAAAFRREEVEAQLEQAGLGQLTVREVGDRYLDVLGRLP